MHFPQGAHKKNISFNLFHCSIQESNLEAKKNASNTLSNLSKIFIADSGINSEGKYKAK